MKRVGTVMKLSPKLRPCAWDLLVVLTVVLLSVSCAAAFWGRGTAQELTAVVSINGVETERLPLQRACRKTYTAGGYTLQVSVSPEGVRVEQSDCPTQDCVHTGQITRSGQSIVCLPARVVITLQGGAETDAPDLVLG